MVEAPGVEGRPNLPDFAGLRDGSLAEAGCFTGLAADDERAGEGSPRLAMLRCSSEGADDSGADGARRGGAADSDIRQLKGRLVALEHLLQAVGALLEAGAIQEALLLVRAAGGRTEGPAWPLAGRFATPRSVSDPPPRLAKLFSAAQCARYVSFGWSVKHEIREAPGAEPYEYILEWLRPGHPIRPDRWGENWVGLAQGGSQPDALSAQLIREVGPGHPLFKRQLHPIARCVACDDVVFQAHLDGSYLLIHLTWSERTQSVTWPAVRELPTETALDEIAAGHGH
jgi:hypothetical protein